MPHIKHLINCTEHICRSLDFTRPFTLPKLPMSVVIKISSQNNSQPWQRWALLIHRSSYKAINLQISEGWIWGKMMAKDGNWHSTGERPEVLVSKPRWLSPRHHKYRSKSCLCRYSKTCRRILHGLTYSRFGMSLQAQESCAWSIPLCHECYGL